MKQTKNVSRQKFENTRKLLRKQKRQQKKVQRQEHYLKKKNNAFNSKHEPGKYVKRPVDVSEMEVQVKVNLITYGKYCRIIYGMYNLVIYTLQN